jgi:hypothetical protein
MALWGEEFVEWLDRELEPLRREAASSHIGVEHELGVSISPPLMRGPFRSAYRCCC